MRAATTIIPVLLCAALSAFGGGAPSLVSSVADGSGGVSTGLSITNISAAGQPGGTAVSSGGGLVNYAGFINTFSVRPSLDTDGDGLADELDPDNDGDGLSDASEITGDGFEPPTATDVNLADTDDDGFSDLDEAAAGTDPTDDEAGLIFVGIGESGASRAISWKARGNEERTYVLRESGEAGTPPGPVIFSNTVSGGSAPWYAVTATVVHAGVSTVQTYTVVTAP